MRKSESVCCTQDWKFDDHVGIFDSFKIFDGVRIPENSKITKEGAWNKSTNQICDPNLTFCLKVSLKNIFKVIQRNFD